MKIQVRCELWDDQSTSTNWHWTLESDNEEEYWLQMGDRKGFLRKNDALKNAKHFAKKMGWEICKVITI